MEKQFSQIPSGCDFGSFICARSYLEQLEVPRIEEAVRPETRRVLADILTPLFDRVVFPLLSSSSYDEIVGLLRLGSRIYLDASAALRALGIASHSSGSADEAKIIRIGQAAHELAGHDAQENAEFAESTFQSARKLLRKLNDSSLPLPPEQNDNDRRLCEEFHCWSSTYAVLAVTLIKGAAEEVPPSEETSARLIDMFRESSLRTYAAVRGAIRLRKPHEDVPDERHPFDEEDARLANMPRHRS